MPALCLSGIPLPVLSEPPLQYDYARLGERRRAFSGFAFSSTRRKVLTLSGNTGPLAKADARVYRALLDGEGHSWDFTDGFVSSRGLLPSFTTGDMGAGDSSGRFEGDSCLEFLTGQGDRVEWELGYVGAWTLLVWRFDWTANLWRHWTLRRNPTGTVSCWKDGVPTAQSVGCTVTAAGTLRIDFTDYPTPERWSNLVALPYAVPDSWPAHVFASGAAVGPLPYHRATGAALDEPLLVLGDAGRGRAMEWWEGGSYVQGQAFDFELIER